jgi:hypothetical protein
MKRFAVKVERVGNAQVEVVDDEVATAQTVKLGVRDIRIVDRLALLE